MELTNKVAVITGAGSGIGAAVARNLNEDGVNLVLTGRRENRLVKLKRELTGAEILPGDITNPALPDSLIQMTLKTSLWLVSNRGWCKQKFSGIGMSSPRPNSTSPILCNPKTLLGWFASS
jgi:NADP-dependent 3-hydroxy acid dehydrogenase YdfG